MKKVMVVLFSIMVVACNSNPGKDNSAASAQTNGKQADAQAAAAQGGAAANDLAGKSIYFDLNTAVVTSSFTPLVQKEAEYIKQHKQAVTLEGNCDERGSDEYNLALGQRRADAVKKLLVAAGVHTHQVKTTSLGKEKPKATCHDESCWKENRRVDFVQG